MTSVVFDIVGIGLAVLFVAAWWMILYYFWRVKIAHLVPRKVNVNDPKKVLRDILAEFMVANQFSYQHERDEYLKEMMKRYIEVLGKSEREVELEAKYQSLESLILEMGGDEQESK